jgi:hypothetical protein
LCVRGSSRWRGSRAVRHLPKQACYWEVGRVDQGGSGLADDCGQRATKMTAT